MNPNNSIISSEPYHALSSDSTPSSDQPLTSDSKIQEAASSRFEGLSQALDQSKVLQISPFIGCVVVGAVFLATNPVGWMLTAAFITILAIGSLGILALSAQTALSKSEQEKLSFEGGALWRVMRNCAGFSNYNEIVLQDNVSKPPSGKLYLGALPNGLLKDLERLTHEEHITAQLSLNQQWELEPRGLSLPYSQAQRSALQIQNYKLIEARDHDHPLTIDQLTETADFIHQQLEAGNNLYVNCKAGQGRSAMAIAAYLIKYQGMTVDEAIKLIKSHRPNVTLGKLEKINRLKGFHARYGKHPQDPLATGNTPKLTKKAKDHARREQQRALNTGHTLTIQQIAEIHAQQHSLHS